MISVRKKYRDIQLHAAVTIMNRVNSVEIFGDPKPEEIAQFAVQLDAKFAPFTKAQFEIAFDGLRHHCLEKARAAGLLKAGQ